MVNHLDCHSVWSHSLFRLTPKHNVFNVKSSALKSVVMEERRKGRWAHEVRDEEVLERITKSIFVRITAVKIKIMKLTLLSQTDV